MITIQSDHYLDVTYEACENISTSAFGQKNHVLRLSDCWYGADSNTTDRVLGFEVDYDRNETSTHYTAKEIFHYVNLTLFRISADFLGHKDVVIKTEGVDYD